MQKPFITKNNLIRFSVALLLVLSLVLMTSSEVMEALYDTGCDDHCDNCGDCINCLPSTYLMLSSSYDNGFSDQIHLWNIHSSLVRIKGANFADIDRPPRI